MSIVLQQLGLLSVAAELRLRKAMVLQGPSTPRPPVPRMSLARVLE